MDTPRRPSLANRTMSSPLSVDIRSTKAYSDQLAAPWKIGLSILTPPSSPRHSRSSSNITSASDDSSPDRLLYQESNFASHGPSEAERNEDGILVCPFDTEILKDRHGRKQTFGYGAWSTVFKATCRVKSTSGLATPPLSPAPKPPLFVAIKQPARKDAQAIIYSEAKVLSFLMSKPDNEQYVVSFYGLLLSNSALVLEPLPLSLDEHIKKSVIAAKPLRTTWNMTEPVIGNTSVWLSLAHKLISALSWLHEKAMVVHGDIKPGNILLDRASNGETMDLTHDETQFPYEPLLADFSSSQRLDGELTPNTLSAITREYTAPELLSSKVLLDPTSTATTASDVFSLAVTLLVAATGNTMVYSGSVFQRQAMATQGWMVIHAVRNGPIEEGARVPRQGVVERALDQAVLRQGMGRIDAASWKSRVEDMLHGEPKKT